MSGEENDEVVDNGNDNNEAADSGNDSGSDAGADAGAGRVRRQRKQTQRWSVKAVEKVEWEVPEGSGVRLSEQPYVEEMVRKLHYKDILLTKIHRMMYNRAGAAKKIKANILAFSGLSDLDEEAEDRLVQRLNKFSTDLLKRIMDTLGINRSSLSFEDGKVTKDNLIDRTVEWLKAPTETDAKPPSQKRKRSKTPKRSKSTTKKRTATKAPSSSAKRPAKKARKKKVVIDDDEMDLPDGLLERAREIVEKSDTSELSLKAIYKQLNSEFDIELEKPQKKVVKALVMRVVEEDYE